VLKFEPDGSYRVHIEMDYSVNGGPSSHINTDIKIQGKKLKSGSGGYQIDPDYFLKPILSHFASISIEKGDDLNDLLERVIKVCVCIWSLSVEAPSLPSQLVISEVGAVLSHSEMNCAF